MALGRAKHHDLGNGYLEVQNEISSPARNGIVLEASYVVDSIMSWNEQIAIL